MTMRDPQLDLARPGKLIAQPAEPTASDSSATATAILTGGVPAAKPVAASSQGAPLHENVVALTPPAQALRQQVMPIVREIGTPSTTVPQPVTKPDMSYVNRLAETVASLRSAMARQRQQPLYIKAFR